tara:strand:+ start:66 stop:512 length:447 start_codon:yes stop_codon:yes gene_type:complete
MPKRFIPNYEDKKDDDNRDSIYNILTEEDYLNNPTTKNILMDHHHTTFILKLENKITNFCDYFLNTNKSYNFLNNDEFGYYYMDVLNIIYDHISIKYDTTIFEFQEKMLYDVFYEEEKKQLSEKKKGKIKNNIQNNNKFDWNTKTYKK